MISKEFFFPPLFNIGREIQTSWNFDERNLNILEIEEDLGYGWILILAEAVM